MELEVRRIFWQESEHPIEQTPESWNLPNPLPVPRHL